MLVKDDVEDRIRTVRRRLERNEETCKKDHFHIALFDILILPSHLAVCMSVCSGTVIQYI